MANQIAEGRVELPAVSPVTPEEIARLLMGVAYTPYIMKFAGKPDQYISRFIEGLVETLS